MQSKIRFIIEKCGGDSLSHIIAATPQENYEFDTLGGGNIIAITRWDEDKGEASVFWKLLIDTKEAKLEDQPSETIDALFEILGG